MFKTFESEILLVAIFLIILWVIGHLFTKKMDVTGIQKFDLTIRKIAALSVFLVTYNIYLSIRSNERIEKNRISYNTLQNIQRNWLDPQAELLKAYPEGYFLYKSMTPDAEFLTVAPAKFDDAKKEQVEVYASMRIFQAMEDFLTTGSYDITGKNVWINNFLMWMQSPILRKNWRKLRFNYSDDTRLLVERIILKGNELIILRQKKGRLTTEDYDTVSNAFDVKFR